VKGASFFCFWCSFFYSLSVYKKGKK